MNIREYEIVQNVGLSAWTLWNFVDSYVRAANGQQGPTVLHTLPILPLAFHADSAEALSRRHLEGGFYTALTEHRDLFLGLQSRMQDMAPQTFRAINLACSSKLLTYLRERRQLYTIRRTQPFEVENQAVKRIRATARRVGHWFATIPPEELGQRLQLRF